MNLKQLTEFLSGLDITGLINAPWQAMYIRDNTKNVTLFCDWPIEIKNIDKADTSIRKDLAGAMPVDIKTLSKYIFDNTCSKKAASADQFVKAINMYYGASRIQKERTFAPSKSNLDSYLTNGRLKAHVYHSSSRAVALRKSSSAVLWFALDKTHALLGWHKNALLETNSARTYVASISGRIATSESNTTKLFNNAKIDIDDYVTDIVGNPTSKEMLDHPGTKLLLAAGFDGFIYYDYNPSDFNKDLEALVIFNLQTIQNWKLLKENK